MSFLNYKLRRNILFEFISSIELDMRYYLEQNNVDFNIFSEKIDERIKKYDGSSLDSRIDFLDFSDYVELLNNCFKETTSNSKNYRDLINELKKIIPIRNRVMHSRPLLADDENIVLSFINKSKNYHSIINLRHLEASVDLIDKNPNIFFEKNPNFDRLYIQNSVENNLPFTDYDDTGFIGREEKKKEIKKRLYGRYPVITIIGDGGIGKTSTVLSLLYDLIDEEDFPFEKVLWTSLKTKTLADGEFKQLKSSIKSFDDCIKNNDILNKESVNGIDDLLFYMGAFKTLLILDNLETINANDVRKLFEDVPEGSKILITSRIGIGEFETRVVLDAFTKDEASVYFRRLTDAYDVDLLKNIKDYELSGYLDKLYYSPLCIKWFIINVGKGNNPDIVIKNQSEIVEYCLSNVFDKLSTDSKNVLTIMMVKQRDYGMAEIVYVNDKDYQITANAVNELCACNFLQQVDRGIYSVPEFARKYLSNKINSKDPHFIEALSRSNRLEGILENLHLNKSVSIKNKPLSLDPKTDSEKISTVYMLSFIEASNEQNLDAMDDWFEKATKAAPTFADLYKVAGYCYAKNNIKDKARECFEISLSQSNVENKPYIESIYSIFLNNQLGDYNEAKKHIKIALEYQPDNEYFLANYARVLKYEKNFLESKKIILDLLKQDSQIDIGFRAKMTSEYVDLEFRIIDESGESIDSQVTKIDKLIDYVENIKIDLYSFGLYKCFKKIFDYLLKFSSNNKGLRKLGQRFIRRYFPYVFLFEKTPIDRMRFINQVNEYFDLNYKLDNLNFKFDGIEYGFVREVNFDKKCGTIKGMNKFFGFYFSDVNFDTDMLHDGLKVSFVAKFYKGWWRSGDINIPSFEKELD